jgi:hypothetical protein
LHGTKTKQISYPKNFKFKRLKTSQRPNASEVSIYRVVIGKKIETAPAITTRILMEYISSNKGA